MIVGSALTDYSEALCINGPSLFAQDPAEPLFESTPAFIRLDPSDAEFVDVIHTDAKSLLVFGKKTLLPYLGKFDWFWRH